MQGIHLPANGWCNWQNSANRPDTKNRAILFDEAHHLRNGRSSSAAAKYADAFFKISLASRNSRTSRSRAFMRALSSLLKHSRVPASRSACRLHARRLSGEQPSLDAMALYKQRSAHSNDPPDHLIHCADQLELTGIITAVFAEKPDATFAEFSGVTRGIFSLCHRVHPVRVLPSSKPGAVQSAWGVRSHNVFEEINHDAHILPGVIPVSFIPTIKIARRTAAVFRRAGSRAADAGRI